ncbi:hypothetical protein BR93DRAFT_592191 [Coniochaeta sp. PMI_546]|nr:hypothetical protein BR93DRAFT_592191 [Coniochaeta sp. PMI_546]
MQLRHIHLPDLTPYPFASQVQEHLRRTLLSAKDSPTRPPPSPTLLTFTPPPTYTLGRRQTTTPLSPQDISRLRAPLTTRHGIFRPDLIPSPRGGLTTYHGPGQLVVWPVVDIRSPAYRNFTVRSYACLLERTTISALGALFGDALEGFTTQDPGVWVRSAWDGVERKVAAVGVHLRRHVTSLGTAVNLDFPGGATTAATAATAAAEAAEGGREEVDPWARFVPCGLEGKEATSVAREVEGLVGARAGVISVRCEEAMARAWAEEFARRIGVEGVQRDQVTAEELEALGVEGLFGEEEKS